MKMPTQAVNTMPRPKSALTKPLATRGRRGAAAAEGKTEPLAF